jgi:RNA recognition motif-containing protein
MPTPAEAQAAINALNGHDFQGRRIVANEARPRRDSNDMGPRMDRGFSSDRGNRPRGRPA